MHVCIYSPVYTCILAECFNRDNLGGFKGTKLSKCSRRLSKLTSQLPDRDSNMKPSTHAPLVIGVWEQYLVSALCCAVGPLREKDLPNTYLPAPSGGDVFLVKHLSSQSQLAQDYVRSALGIIPRRYFSPRVGTKVHVLLLQGTGFVSSASLITKPPRRYCWRCTTFSRFAVPSA